MGTATCTITDKETSTTITLSLDESGPSESTSPPPSGIGKDRKRAIVQHPIPTLDRDVGQDMGAYSNEYRLDGISHQDVRDALDNFFQVAQFTEAHPDGRFHVRMTDSGGTVRFEKQGLVIKNYSWAYAGGRKNWFRYTVTFVEFQGQP